MGSVIDTSNGFAQLGFGLMRLPLKAPKLQPAINLEKTVEMVDTYMGSGFNHFDTSIVYHAGKSETALRKAVVERYPREAFTVTDKMPMFTVKAQSMLAPTFRTELRRCGVKYFDYYWLHSLDEGSFHTSEKIGAFDFVRDMQEKGKILHLGFSFHDKATVLDEILTKHPEMEYVQLQINYLDWEDEKVESRKCWETAVKHGKKIMVMEPLKGGKLAKLPDEAQKLLSAAEPDYTPASWALRFVASLENVTHVLSGMSTQEQLEENIRLMKNISPITQRETSLLMTAADIIRGIDAVPCTACRYCTDGCPAGIDIPGYFSAYNSYKRAGSPEDKAKEFFGSIEGGKPEDCIGCKQCEEHCPQHIKICDTLGNIKW